MGYIGQDSNTVFGLNTVSPIVGVGIQKDVSAGASWSVAPVDLPRHSMQMSVLQHLDNYSANGSNFSDVIALRGIYTDVSMNANGTDTSYHKETAQGTLCIARGVGFIYANVDQYELLNYQSYAGSRYGYTHRIV